MTAPIHILHVDDDPLMRDAVEISLGLDPVFLLLSCANAQEALAAAPDWAPDLILCDVVIPGTDGPALLARLRANTATAAFPVIFMSARMPATELEALRSLGAAAVIAKPFDSEKFAETVRRHLHSIRLSAASFDFSQRLRRDASTLSAFRLRLEDCELGQDLQSFVHKLAGAVGIFNFAAVSVAASTLEATIIAWRAGRGKPGTVAADFDTLLDVIDRSLRKSSEPERGKPT